MTEQNLYEFINNPKVGQTFELSETNEEGQKDEATLICLSNDQDFAEDIPPELKLFLMMLHSTL
jgi:hypothetical protein